MNVFQRKNVFFICCLISSESKCSIQFSRFQLDFFFRCYFFSDGSYFSSSNLILLFAEASKAKTSLEQLILLQYFRLVAEEERKKKKNLNWKIYDEGKGRQRQRQRKFEWDNWGEEIFCLLAKITRNWQENSVSLNRLIFHRWNLM